MGKEKDERKKSRAGGKEGLTRGTEKEEQEDGGGGAHHAHPLLQGVEGQALHPGPGGVGGDEVLHRGGQLLTHLDAGAGGGGGGGGGGGAGIRRPPADSLAAAVRAGRLPPFIHLRLYWGLL